MSLLALALMLSGGAAQTQVVDEFVPYTDGRPGGCYRSPRGQLYNCTRPPAQSPFPAPVDPQALAQDLADLKEEVALLRAELERATRWQADEDARRAKQASEREAAERAALAAKKREQDEALQLFNEIEAAKDSVRRRELEQRTEACRASLERRGYRVMGPGACRAPDGSFVNCPDC